MLVNGGVIANSTALQRHDANSAVGALNATGLYHARLNGTETDDEPESVGQAIAIFYLILAVMIGSQSALLAWKRKHKRSYEGVTLVGLWLFPAVISFHLSFWRFCVVWAAYTGVTGYFLSLCVNRRQLDRSTPKRVYTWFLASHKVSVAAGLGGYLLVVVEVFGGGPVLRALRLPPAASLLLLWYGLYYGVLGRDLAEVASDRMAAVMGGARRIAVSVRNCGICSGELADDSIQLQCKHLFCPLCIRGWTLVGKKSVCPVCMEKVDLRHLYADRPWETRNLSWVQMLDALRYFIVWNPLLLVGVHFVLKELGIQPHPHGHHHRWNGTEFGNGTVAVSSLLLPHGQLLNGTFNASVSRIVV